MEKRVLILTAGFGEGHNAAARGMRDGLTIVGGSEVRIELRDLFAESYGLANDWARKAYLGLINRAPRAWERLYHWIDRRPCGGRMPLLFQVRNRLSELLVRFQPHVVVSVYPAYPHLLEAILQGAPAPFSRVVCVTDSITVNAIWYRCTTDYFLLPNEQTAAVLARSGVPAAQLRVTGFPVTPKFAELGELREPPSSRYGRRILYMINAGRVLAADAIRDLARLPDVRLTVTVGRAEKLAAAVRAIRDQIGRPFDIIGWSDQIPRLMLESHFLISKAGGATVQETIAAACPMIVNQIVPGQEEGNARLLETTGSGVIATTPADVLAAVERAFAEDDRIWREIAANIKQLSRPRAPLEIAEFLLQLAAPTRSTMAARSAPTEPAPSPSARQ